MKKILLLCAILIVATLCLAACNQNAHTHSFGEWEVRKSATCITEGERARYCSCGEKQTEVIYATGIHTEVIEAAVLATCTESGLTEGRYCSTCNQVTQKQEIIPASGHTEVISEAVLPTCTEVGLTEGMYCSECNTILVAQAEIAKTAHTYTDKNDESCNKCGFIRDVKCDHDEVSQIPGVSATCNDTGLTEGRVCILCEEILLEQKIIPALGHNEVIDDAISATCTESGLTEGKHCSACGEILAAQTVIFAKGHTVVNGQCRMCDYRYSVGLEYTSNGDGTCYVSKIGSCIDTDVVIPEISPEGQRVTAIGDYAFYLSKNISSVKIPDSVTTIGEQAFRECTSLTDVQIPYGVTTVAYNTFYECNALRSIMIPSSVTTIGICAFFGCTSLESITIPDSVTTIGRAAFGRCYGLTSVIIPDSVTTVEAEAFCYCHNLTSVKISKNLTSISKGVFATTALTSVIIPDGVTTVGEEAFKGCSLEFIIIPDSVTAIFNGAFQYSRIKSVYYTGSEEQWAEITVGTNNSDLTDAIVKYNYKFCSEGLEYISQGKGACCVMALENYSDPLWIIPSTSPNGESVTSIGDYGFAYCQSPIVLVIPDSVTSIGYNAFAYCFNLTDVYYTGSEEQWAEIDISSSNDYLINATIHYNYVPEE